jgi:ABC-type transport system substrate-binding protein
VAGESFTSNETLDVWTLKLRDGVTWQDGEAFNADDVVFTMNMLLTTPELETSAAHEALGGQRRKDRRPHRPVQPDQAQPALSAGLLLCAHLGRHQH